MDYYRISRNVIEMSDDLKRAELLKTFVENKPDALIVSGSDQCIIAVCSQFDIYVKFSVELPEEEAAVPVSRPNAFSIHVVLYLYAVIVLQLI